MCLRHLLLVFIITTILCNLHAQYAIVKGTITSADGKPVGGASVNVNGTFIAAANSNGEYEIKILAGNLVKVTITHIGYTDAKSAIQLSENEIYTWSPVLIISSKELSEVEIYNLKDVRDQAGLMSITPRNATALTSSFGDFNKVFQSLPGVIANNELSSTYSVRGGSYDENLIYVNGMEVYRPFLVRSGQQEGLSFINPFMVSEIEFSTGGWKAKYGDKLSSVLNVTYKRPQKWGGTASAGLLGGNAHIEAVSKNGRTTAIVGYRHKNGRFLLATLPVEGQYFPSFHDVQSFINFDITNRKKHSSEVNRSNISLLTNYATNDYMVVPTTQDVVFGTAGEILKLTVGFYGAEKMYYTTLQNGLKFSQLHSHNFKTEWYASHVRSREREYVDLEAGYTLCDLDISQGADPNKCLNTKGLGTEFRYSRNRLDVDLLSAENRSYVFVSDKLQCEAGIKMVSELIHDVVNEFAFTDSLSFATIKYYSENDAALNTIRTSSYIQATYKPDTVQSLTIGVRHGYWTGNQENMISPSAQYAIKPLWKRNVIFKLSGGVYRQPPFYRELRNFAGNINLDLRAQNSIHISGGLDYVFYAGKRRFKLTSELYYKHLWNVVPYDFDNVRIRYYALNNAVAYSTGLDTRISGEFIKNEESWVSLSVMDTRENVEGSQQGWIRRPTDQRVTFACFFQDHLPGRPSWKINFTVIFGTGLPIGPPDYPLYRNEFNIPPYKRLDIGFLKVISVGEQKSWFKKIYIGLEMLNAFGLSNTLSYIWVSDFGGRKYGVPNTLSQRFYNVKFRIDF
ncbi:MAG: TonB-dependent receptor plug domain-containing protein [Cytophagales bacterium]|nr:TonB-dependent receptor plug domain-containing protein [Cytophagales bacterium]